MTEVVDKYALKPAARGYRAITPGWLDDSVTRVFENLSDVRSGLNNILQWEWRHAGSNFSRVLVNSTLGVAGIFDVWPVGCQNIPFVYGIYMW